MFAPDTRFTKEFTISSFDVDASKKASLQSISRYMQEMAVLHAEKLKLGFHDMIKQNRVWVLAQMSIKIDRLPGMHEDISITTWSNGPDGRFAMRDFYIRDKQGNLIGAASSTWFVIDIDEKNICRLDEYFQGYNYKDIEYAIDRKPGRVKPFTDSDIKNKIDINYSDLDINAHVNNVRYIDFILNMFTPEFRMDHKILEIEMNFLKEVKLGDRITALLKPVKENEYLHCLVNESAGKPSFSARTRWA